MKKGYLKILLVSLVMLGVLVFVSWLIEVVCFVIEFPEGMLQSIWAYLDEHE